MTNEKSQRLDQSQLHNVIALPDRKTIKEEAAAWLVQLDQGSLSPKQKQNLTAWVNTSDFHKAYLERLCSTWDDMAVLEQLAELFPLPSKPTKTNWRKRLASFFRIGALPPSAAFASLLAIVVVCGSALLLNVTPPEQRTYVTGIGEQATFHLSDGTQLFLNTNSRLQVDYSGERRVITLDYGEANFDVAKNPERPFVVYAGQGLVWAVGTAFNVRYLGEEVDVTVTEGQVKVFSNTQAQDLQVNPLELIATSTKLGTASSETKTATAQDEALIGAGQSVRYEKVINAVALVDKEEEAKKLAWQKGSLIFRGETLSEALIEIGRYTDKKLVVSDPQVGDMKLGGHYKTDDIRGLMTSIEEALGIRVVYHQDDTILLSANTPSP